MNLENVTRIEVIDEEGRSYRNSDKRNKVELQIQDEGRTLKIFIDKKDKNENTEINAIG